MALHYKLHEVGRDALPSAVTMPASSPEAWMALLDQLINEILEYHDLFILQERNRAAIAHLHHERHVSEHDLLEDWFHTALSDQEIDLRDRCAWRAPSKPSWACLTWWVTFSQTSRRRCWRTC